MQRAVALVRCSTDHQDLDHQRQAAAAWAARQDPPVALVFHEEHGTSGAARDRPVLDALLAHAREGRFDVLVVGALDRIGRDVVRIVMALDDLHAAGVRVVSLREGLDFGGPMGRAMAALLGAIAEIERAAIRERVRSGLRAARARGQRLGRPALEWRPEELDAVRAFLAEGLSIRRIAREKRVLVFRRGGAPVAPSASAIRNALRAASA